MDLWHQFGSDLAVGPTGDLASIDVPILTQQRIIRRLMTNVSDYLAHLSYGGGLASFIGRPANALSIQGVIVSQMIKEASVATSPAPIITVAADTLGTVYAHITYADAATGSQQILSLPLE